MSGYAGVERPGIGLPYLAASWAAARPGMRPGMRNRRATERRVMCAITFGLCSLFLPLPAFAWVMSLLVAFLFADIGTVAMVWGALLCVSHAALPAATAWWPALYALALGCILMLPRSSVRR